MASSAKNFFLLFLLTLLYSLHIHARESQFFNKQLDKEPSFIPQTETGFGLYGHDSGQLNPTTTTTTNDEPYTTTTNLPYNTKSQEEPFINGLPENYNTMSYVTKPQGYNHINVGNGYNTHAQKQGMSDTNFLENGKFVFNPSVPYRENYNPNSYDTQFLENGKYFFNPNVPYTQNYNPNSYEKRGYGSRDEYNYKVKSMEGYQNQEEYQESKDEFMP